MWKAARTALKVMKPPPRLSVSEWADRERRLDSQSSSEPGRWYTSRAEYQRGIMDACSDPATPEVVVMAGAQLGKTEAILPKTEQVRGEDYRVGDRIRAYVLDLKKAGQKVKIILSRSHPDFVRKLFELEVPEMADGLIEVKALVREAGYKTKMAVLSKDAKVDAIGACVGVRGTRIKNVLDELKGEKVDVIRWSDNTEELIANSLKPAQVNYITLDSENMRAKVVVDDDQLSLAIGRRGQNVRLAAKLGKWDISILTESEMQEGAPELEESPDRIGRFDDDLELGGAGLTGADDFEEPEATGKE